ncbi:MAG: hypothetical protein JF590_00560, partial [Gemmatimonadetes bacterium]|nr:hypothetical protein [Gemmatimonadota bacterium]
SLQGELRAQHRWSVTLERGSTTYSMAAHDTSTPEVRVVPWHPGAWTVRVARDGARTGYALALTAANGQVGATIGDAVILPGVGLLLLEVAPEVRRRLTTSATGATLVVHLGPVVDIWAPQGDDVRTASGAMGGLTLALPVAGRWQAAIRADLAVTGSEATRAEESASIKRARTMRRGRLALGITRTF